MLGMSLPPNSSVSLLADHLDMTLAAGEDLLAERLAPPADQVEPMQSATALAEFVQRLLRHEAAIVAHMLQARRLAGSLQGLPAPVRPVVALMLSSTASVLSLISTFGGASNAAFESGGDAVAFLRSRGLVAADAADRPRFTELSVGDDYRIGATVQLGPLLDVTAASLDALDLAFGLYPEPEADEAASDEPAAAKVSGNAATTGKDRTPDTPAGGHVKDTAAVIPGGASDSGADAAAAGDAAGPAKPVDPPAPSGNGQSDSVVLTPGSLAMALAAIREELAKS